MDGAHNNSNVAKPVLPKRHFSTQPRTTWDYFEYDVTARTMTIYWRDKATRKFENVSISHWTRLCESRSKLAFINRYLVSLARRA